MWLVAGVGCLGWMTALDGVGDLGVAGLSTVRRFATRTDSARTLRDLAIT